MREYPASSSGGSSKRIPPYKCRRQTCAEKEKVMCPVCGRRILDIETHGLTVIDIKCPHCRNIVCLERE